MLGRSAAIEIPRRLMVWYVAFAAIAIVWLAVNALLTAQSLCATRGDRDLLAYADYAATTVALARAAGSEPEIQTLIERFARERALAYCALVSESRMYLAHSRRRLVGQMRETPDGQVLDCDGYPVLRYVVGDGYIREYSIPVPGDVNPSDTLFLAVAEPGSWATVKQVVSRVPFLVLGPVLVLVLGGFWLQRAVRPLSAVESQLRRLALAPTVTDAALTPIRAHSAGGVGWNRLLQELQAKPHAGGLNERLTEAVQTLRQERADDVLNSLADGIAVTDQDGRISFANQSLAALLGEAAAIDSLRGQSVEDSLALDEHDFDNPLLDPELWGRPVEHEVDRLRRGSRQVLRIARYPIRSADRATKAGHVWAVRDVTQQKLADEMRDQFLDHATHELRTPLSNIKAYAETLAMTEVLDVESQKEFCNTINAEATRLARFIDDLLSVSSMEAGSLALEKQNVDPERLFSEVVGKVRPQMDQKGITFEAIFPQKYPETRLDKDKINVALVNLLGNAAKYTPAGGHVRFEVKANERELRFEVEDSGIGISEEELPRIFDKFFRSSSPQVKAITGTGLGLSMALEVIHLHGGELTVTSQLGQGTTFTATVPLQ